MTKYERRRIGRAIRKYRRYDGLTTRTLSEWDNAAAALTAFQLIKSGKLPDVWMVTAPPLKRRANDIKLDFTVCTPGQPFRETC